MFERFEPLPQRQAIIDREAIAAELAALAAVDRAMLVERMKAALDAGRVEIERRLLANPSRGLDAANAQAFLVDQAIRLLFDATVERLYLNPNPSAGERIAILAVGGYGRGEMAPFSDVDIAFVTPWKQSSWTEQVIEALLYSLWDLGLKVGHSSRSVDDTTRQAREDMTIRTALLESRLVCGDETVWAEVSRRYRDEVKAGTAPAFIAAKLAERNARHVRMGDSRYVVEPNVKEGKGSLRDIHTLFWIGKYAYDVQRAAQLIDAGLFSPSEYRHFHRADDFLWAVRCHLHAIAGRAEERLTFDYQREIAERMRFADRPGKSRVERFMQYYFLQAKSVGDLSGVFLAHLDESFAARGGRFGLPKLRRRPRKLDGFVLDRGRLALPEDGFLKGDPVRLIDLFWMADRHGLEIHPSAMRAAAREAKLADDIRDDPRANALFLDVLTSPRDPEMVLRWMNEAGVFGRFVPDFGRVVAQMQFDMYHHYTVDEHTIRAIGLLAKIERGDLKADHPLTTALMQNQIVSRRVLYVAVLLHDIAKGRGGDHSVLGAEVAERLCPRLGLTAAETETVAWLVRWHLLMAATAFKRDLADAKTIADFCEQVQSPERLRLLLALTVVDIRAVGPTTWNGWKRQLLGDLYEAAEEVLRLGHKQHGRIERIADKQRALKEAMGWSNVQFARFSAKLPEAYWLAEPADVLERNARFVGDAADTDLAIEIEVYPARDATLVTVYAADHPGLFYRIAGAIHVSGGNIIDARIHTTNDGMALDNFLVQNPAGGAFSDPRQLDRIRRVIAEALQDEGALAERLRTRTSPASRADAFDIAPRVLIDNRASNRFTVVEVNARDRPALLSDLAEAVFQSKATIHSAHVATYGERAVDVFYVTGLDGEKLVSAKSLRPLEKRLHCAAEGPDQAVAA